MTFGEELTQAREQKNLSQEELAEQLGVSRQAVSKWENNAAIPQGVNRELLHQLLDLETSAKESPTAPKRSLFGVLGWAVAAVLLTVLVMVSLPKEEDTPPAEAVSSAEEPTPAITSIKFYDAEQNEVLPEALWYDNTAVKSVLVQWTGGTPIRIQMAYCPAGSETASQVEVLLSKSVLNGDSAALLSTSALSHKPMGHVYFELEFGSFIMVSDTYNFYDAPSQQAAP